LFCRGKGKGKDKAADIASAIFIVKNELSFAALQPAQYSSEVKSRASALRHAKLDQSLTLSPV
jgi:hypothetical protein